MSLVKMIGTVIAACVLAFELTQFAEYWMKLQAQDYDSIIAGKIGLSNDKEYYNDKNYHIFMTINAFMVSIISVYFMLRTLGYDIGFIGKPIEEIARIVQTGKSDLLKFATGSGEGKVTVAYLTGILLALSIMSYQFLNASEHIVKASRQDYSTYLSQKWETSENVNKGYFIMLTIASVSLVFTTSIFVLKLFSMDQAVKDTPVVGDAVNAVESVNKTGRSGLRDNFQRVGRYLPGSKAK